ncbi:MAG: M42 family peptidase [Candidatus Micrarchaeota archaeon]
MLDKLINAVGISGMEDDVRKIIKKEIGPHVDSIRIDKVGNLVAHKKGTKPTVMLAAHMDEVGLMVREIEDDGKIRFSAVGGLDGAALICRRVSLGKIKGVITTKELSRGEEIKELPAMENLYVDTGLTKKELERSGIRIGTYISFYNSGYATMGSEKIIAGKALDDRLGCFVLIELAKRLKKAKEEIFYVFTVQEEMGMYGAKISAYDIKPDWAIVVDVTDANGESRKMGEGPCITIMDSEMIGNRCINGWMEAIAKRKRMKVQLEVSDSGTTDALSISLSRGGVPTAVVGVAIKNMHTPASMAHLDDIKNSVTLVELLLRSPPKICIV